MLKFKFIFCFAVVLFSTMGFAQQKLLLVGGGNRPREALKVWLSSESTEAPQVMLITWASETQKQKYEESIKSDLIEAGVPAENFFASREINPENKQRFLEELKKCTHIYFSGGQQFRIMHELQDGEILRALGEAYWHDAKPVAGTSAGTSVQAEKMIVDDNTPLQKGLGFLPKSVIDQHFFKRKRQKRLRHFMAQAPHDFVGIGVDEDGSIIFTKDKTTQKFTGRVYGQKNVLIIGRRTGLRRPEKILTSKSAPLIR